MKYAGRAGERVGMLTFAQLTGQKERDGHRVYGLFRCDCGGERITAVGRVLNNRAITHCGCQGNKAPNRTHGMKYTGTYSSWCSAKDRATNRNSKDYCRYGAVGIGMSDDWLQFENFLRDMGERPPGMTLDRIDGTKGYEAGNCRWATPSEQTRNRRRSYRWTIKGLTFETVYEAAAHFGVSAHTVFRWVRGAFDKRRGTFTKPRSDCYAISRY